MVAPDKFVLSTSDHSSSRSNSIAAAAPSLKFKNSSFHRRKYRRVIYSAYRNVSRYDITVQGAIIYYKSDSPAQDGRRYGVCIVVCDGSQCCLIIRRGCRTGKDSVPVAGVKTPEIPSILVNAKISWPLL